MELGKTIRQLRRERHWAIEDLVAYLDGVKGGDQASISKIETGLRWPRQELLSALAKAFELKVYQLLALAEEGCIPVADVTPEEQEWLICLRAMPPTTRGHLLAVMRDMEKR